MPGLKKLIVNIRLGKEKKVEPCSPVVEDQPALKRANARLRKKNGSSVNISSGLGIVHNSFPIRNLSFSRQNSFEPGQSIKDFDLSPVSRRDIPLIGASRPVSSDEFAASDPSRSQHDGEQVKSIEREVHPINLATAAANSALQRRSIRYSRSSLNVRPTLKIVNTDPEPIEDSDDEPLSSASEWARLDRHPKAKLPAIHDLDWDKLTDEEVRNIAKAYDNAAPSNYSHSSFADSGIAMSISRSGSEKAYSGKGKSRQRSSSYLSRRMSDAMSESMEAWYEAETEFENDGDRETLNETNTENSSRVSRRDTALDIPQRLVLGLREIDHRVQIETKQFLEQAWEVDRLEEEERLHADAWEMESRLYLVESAQRDRREQEERERKAQEELERLEEELLQEALREIAEDERREKERRLAEERARLRDCCVCGDSQDKDKFPEKAPAVGCEHPPNTCNECLEAWMASEFETKGCDGIKCPECPQTLEYQEVQEAASQETFAAYDKLTIRNALGSLDEFAWCLKPECGSGQLNIDNNDFMDCVSCHYKQCLRHKVPWHNSETCEQYEYRVSGQKQRDEAKKEEEMLNNLSKKCPGPNCGWRIEKIDGCEHMTCKRCKHQFCWICLADHLEIKRIGNTAHNPSCKFHSTNLDLAWPFNMH